MKEVEISHVSDKEFKAMIIKVLKKLRRMDEEWKVRRFSSLCLGHINNQTQMKERNNWKYGQSQQEIQWWTEWISGLEHRRERWIEQNEKEF